METWRRTGAYMERKGTSETRVQELNCVRPLGTVQRAKVRQANRKRQQRAVNRRKERRLSASALFDTTAQNYNGLQ